MRRIPTTMGVALLNAALRSPQTWQAKQVIERAQYTQQGTKAQPSVEVHVRQYTAAKIAEEQGVRV